MTVRHAEWRWIRSELRRFGRPLLALSGLSVLEIAFRMLLPWPLKAIVDHLAGGVPMAAAPRVLIGPLVAAWDAVGVHGRFALLGAIIVAALGVQLGHQAVLLAHGRLQAMVGLAMVRQLREQLFAHLQALELVHHDRQPTGDAVYRLETDAAFLEVLVLRGLFPYVFSIATLVAMFGVLLRIDWRLALASLAVVPLLLLWMRWRTARIAARARAARQAEAEMALTSGRRVHEVLRLPREDRERPDAIRLPRLTGRVEFDRVSFSFGDGPRVLEDISFIAEPGQMVALVGPSGSGKSTLASLMPLFRYPTSGVIRFDGLDARRLELDGLRRQIAVVLQEAVVLSGSVMENLRYGRLDATDDEIREAARLAHADEFIAALPHGYRTVLAEAGRSLSGGQRQRLSLARAFLRDAPIVVLDEPTAALDTVSEQHILQGVERLRQRRTVFVIAHRLVTVRQAEVILVLDRGRIAARGRHDDLMRTSPLYHRLATAMIEPRP